MMLRSFIVLSILLLDMCCENKATHAQMASMVEDWPKSRDTVNTALINSLKKEINQNTYQQINSIIVIKSGGLLLEEYFNGASRNQTHDPRSVGKTFASALLGIALQEGYIKSVDQTLADFYDLRRTQRFSDKKASVSLKHLLTMSAAFEGDDHEASSPGNEENMYPQDNWVEWTLNLPMASNRNSGEEWHYFTAGVVLLGDILNQKVPNGLEKYADEKLFKPLGITYYQWMYTPQQVPSTAGGIRLRHLDFAKFGQLYLNKGKWNKQQILPEAWIDESFRKYQQTTITGNYYGYLWWNKTYKVNNTSFATFYCSGNGGNKIFVFPEAELVIVITAQAYNQRYAHTQVDQIMEKYLLPAVVMSQEK